MMLRLLKINILLFILYFLCLPVFSYGQQQINSNPIGNIHELHPGQSVQRALEQLNPGDQLLLHEGIYEGNLKINISGTPALPITIRGYGNGEKRPVLLYKGKKNNLIEITGNNLILDYLEFNSANTYGIRIGNPDVGVNNITIQYSTFTECGGGDISANDYNVSYDNIRVLYNFFNGSKRTPVYIGSHPGNTSVTHFIFKGNTIDGSQNDGPESTIGYGIELKLNVTKSIIEDNFITGTKGPGIMVYGSTKESTYGLFNAAKSYPSITTNRAYSNIVRNNIVINSRKNPGIVVGGGPSIVQNNVVINSNGGIMVSNYGNRNLTEGIIVTNNTVIQNQQSGIVSENEEGLMIRNNLVVSGNKKKAFAGLSDSADKTENSYSPIPNSLKEALPSINGMLPERENMERIFMQVMSGPMDIISINRLLQVLKTSSSTVRVWHH